MSLCWVCGFPVERCCCYAGRATKAVDVLDMGVQATSNEREERLEAKATEEEV